MDLILDPTTPDPTPYDPSDSLTTPPSPALLYPHSLLRQAILVPYRLLTFCTRNGEPHWGQGSGTGLSQVANLHFGYCEHP